MRTRRPLGRFVAVALLVASGCAHTTDAPAPSNRAGTDTIGVSETTLFVSPTASMSPSPTATRVPAPSSPRVTTPSPLPSFGPGAKVVGRDILPGTYRTRTGSVGCHWER